MRPTNMQVFSTAGLPDERRVELWESHNASALIGLSVRATSPLRAAERNVQLAHLHLARVTGTAHVVERSAELIRRDPSCATAVYLSLRGDSWFQHRDGRYSLRPGDVIACDPDQPFARGFARGLEELVVKVPRAVLSGRCGVSAALLSRGAPLVRATTSGRDQVYARALARMAGTATRANHPVPADEDALIDLVAVLTAGRQVAQAVAHRAAAKSYIEDHLTDPDLGAEQVAHAIGISTRQLSRVFAVGDTSIPRHILARRLTLAYSLLAAPPGAAPAPAPDAAASPGAAAAPSAPASPASAGAATVADVAARCGFTSATYFSHAFAAHFGQRASEVRSDGLPHP
jgi:AraC-like DNA-binding protein